MQYVSVELPVVGKPQSNVYLVMREEHLNTPFLRLKYSVVSCIEDSTRIMMCLNLIFKRARKPVSLRRFLVVAPLVSNNLGQRC